MKKRRSLHQKLTIAVSMLLGVAACARVQGQTDEQNKQFEQKIRPVLVAKCLSCHGAAKQEGGLRLDTFEAVLAGGDSGPAISVGKPNESLVIEALRYESYEMPPTGQLPENTVRQFEQWIAAGAFWPDASQPLREQKGVITDVDRQWWAFQPVHKFSPPEQEHDHWSQGEIDQFVFARLDQFKMHPAQEAKAETLVRRLYFDLIGLQPTPNDVEEYLRDNSPNAWESLVDRLLDDPRYGEHWARFWLDLVRYSESDGWNQDAYRPEIWRYRDYVIDAFNSDKPYPQFVLEQLAGDEIDADQPEHLAASGYLRLGIYEYNQRDSRGLWNDIMNEITDVTGDAFLGLSMQCARCHDHKFDAIPQTDYFQLRAFFEPLVWRDDLSAATEKQQREHSRQLEIWRTAAAETLAKIDELLEPYNKKKWESTVDKFPLDIQACFHMPVEDRTSWQHQMAYLVSRQFLEEGGGPLKDMTKEDKARHEELKKELATFDHLKPAPLPKLMTATDFDGVLSPTVIPDDADRRQIEPGFLTVMQHADLGNASHGPAQALNIKPNTSGRRTALAKWIGDSENPLTTRVIVNRIWQQHFGQGIAATSSDFGTQGHKPSHPELLDWLTATFVEDGWSMKKLHKRILMSATWRQAAYHPSAADHQAKDPSEQLLWRSRVRRLQAEQIRDSMLAASGELTDDIGGPSVDVKTPRRSIYLKCFRNQNDTFLHGFDIANGLKSVPVRDTTTTPTQALLLINGEFTIERATAMAARIQAESDDPTTVITLAYRWAWGRAPSSDEVREGLNFVGAQPGEDAEPIASERLSDLCHVLFNSNQFLYVE